MRNDEKDALEKLEKLDAEITTLKANEQDDPRVSFGYDIKPMKDNNWFVRLYVKPKLGFDINEIDKVVYVLHPTFSPNTIARNNPDSLFSLEFQSWGDFHAMAVVAFKDSKKNVPVELVRWLPIGVLDEPQRM